MSSVMLSPQAARAPALRSHALDEPAGSVEDITGRVVGLHNTSPVSPFLSASARLASFVRRDLATPMWASWELARFRGMRNTMFVFTRADLPMIAAATRELKTRVHEPWFRDAGLTPAQFHRLAARVDAALGEHPMTVRELRRELAERGWPFELQLRFIVREGRTFVLEGEPFLDAAARSFLRRGPGAR